MSFLSFSDNLLQDGYICILYFKKSVDNEVLSEVNLMQTSKGTARPGYSVHITSYVNLDYALVQNHWPRTMSSYVSGCLMST